MPEEILQILAAAPNTGVITSPNGNPRDVFNARDAAVRRAAQLISQLQVTSATLKTQIAAQGADIEAIQAQLLVIEAQIADLQQQISSLAASAAPAPVFFSNVSTDGSGAYQEAVGTNWWVLGESIYDPSGSPLRTEVRVVPTSGRLNPEQPAFGADNVTFDVALVTSTNNPAISALHITNLGNFPGGVPYQLLARNVADDGRDPSPWVPAPFTIATGAG